MVAVVEVQRVGFGGLWRSARCGEESCCSLDGLRSLTRQYLINTDFVTFNWDTAPSGIIKPLLFKNIRTESSDTEVFFGQSQRDCQCERPIYPVFMRS